MSGWTRATPASAHQHQCLVTRYLVTDIPRSTPPSVQTALPTNCRGQGVPRCELCTVLSGMCTKQDPGLLRGPTENDGCARAEVHPEYGSPCACRSPVAHLCRIDTIRRWMLLIFIVTYIHPPSPPTLSSFPFTPSRTTGRTQGRPDGAHSFPPFPCDTPTVVGPNFPILCNARRKYFLPRWTKRVWRRSPSGLDTNCASSFLHCKVIDFIDLSRLLNKVIFRISDPWGTKRRLTLMNSCSSLRFPCIAYCFTTTF